MNGKLVGIMLLPNTGDKKCDVAMPAREVLTDSKPKKVWDITRFHRIYNHAGEVMLRKTAKAYDWELTGKLEPCQDCLESNTRKKAVEKYTESKSHIPGERIFLDGTSIKHRSLGGSRFLVVAVDDATRHTWGRTLTKKSEQNSVIMRFLRLMKSRGTPVKFIRLDNAGENKDLQKKCQETSDLNDITFEFTGRDNPQANGVVERKIAVIFSRMRVLLAAAKIPVKLKNKLWAEVAMTAIDIENLLVSANQEEPSYRKFFKKDMPKAEEMKQFGEMGIVKIPQKIKGKLANRGIPGMYLGRAKDHAADTYKLLNIKTERVIVSRDVIWLDKVYGEVAGTKLEKELDKAISELPMNGFKKSVDEGEDEAMEGATGGVQRKEPSTRKEAAPEQKAEPA